MIRQAKPPVLLVIADGPRAGNESDPSQCSAARAIVEAVDWECEVRKHYAEANLGCKRRMSSGVDWVFEQVEEAIILEDDCVPHPTFFPYCEQMLEKFRSDERICQIGGVNFQFGRKRNHYSYYFSRYNHIWGWGSWRRAWKGYDRTMRPWPEIREAGFLKDWLLDDAVCRYWDAIFEKVYNNGIDTWDYQWTFHSWINGRLAVLPNVNLITNIGHGADATHTFGYSRFDNMPATPMEFPLVHPPFILRDDRADRFTENHHYLVNRIRNLPRRVNLLLHVLYYRLRSQQ
jgi:hypothetical protein